MIDHNTVLNMWAAGTATARIAAAVGTLYDVTIQSIISQGRRDGDPRAKRVVKRGEGFRATQAANMKAAVAMRRRRALGHLAVKFSDMDAAVRAYTGPITICPPAVHLGHRPKCLVELGL